VLHHALTVRIGAARATGFERSSFGRNSKLLQAWTRGQINLAPASASDNRRLVLSCGKCSNGEEFPPYGIKLNPEAMVYEVEPSFNLEAWEKELTEGKRTEPEDALLELWVRPISRNEAVRELIEHGYSRATAYRAIKTGSKKAS